MPEQQQTAAPEPPALVAIALIGQHPVLGEPDRVHQRQLVIRDLPVKVNADGANGLTRGTAARCRELGVWVPAGVIEAPLAAYYGNDWGKRSEWEPAGRGPYGLDAPENGGKRIFGDDDEIAYRAWGFALDSHGEPYVQMPGDPAPGAYLSTTALFDPNYHETDPRRYVDSAAIPGFTLPGRDLEKLGVQLGDFALVTFGPYSIWAQAVDRGNSGELLELSIAACEALGIPDCARSGGVPGGVDIQILPGSGHQVGWLPAKREQITTAGRAAAAAVGLVLEGGNGT